MSLKDEFWEDHHKECPWNDNGCCLGQISYNQHINNPQHNLCSQYYCPIFFWVTVLHEHRPNVYGKQEV